MSQKTDNDFTPAIPKDAATVILLRTEPENKAFEVLLMRRHARQNFMGKAFVYPGGQLDEMDGDPKLAAYTNGFSAETARRWLHDPDLSDAKARGYYFAAVRETFEESGVLLAGLRSGRGIDFNDSDIKKRFSGYRVKIHQKEITLEELAKRENLVFRLDLLKPFAHWITPELEPKRFDTRFFLTPIPPGQKPVHDSIEMTETLWTTPKDALLKQKAGDILLMPPTLKTLEEMSSFSSIPDLFSYASSRDMPTELPQISVEADRVVIKLPHDPEYTVDAFKQPHRPEELSRFIIRDKQIEAAQYTHRANRRKTED